jgi:RHS repeat-associated protein
MASYKGITSITYNHLNLPSIIDWGGVKSIIFAYDASGVKLSKTVKTGTTVNYVQDYVGGIEYNSPSGTGRKIEAIYHSEGRYYNTSATATPSFRNEYTIKDHLGDARISFTDKNSNGKIDVDNTASNEVIQENNYYAFGMNFEGPWLINDASKDNLYTYNGKEYNADHGLKWSDYGARFYDPLLGVWNGVDKLSDFHPNLTPFSYCSNNPVKFIDPDGRIFIIPLLIAVAEALTAATVIETTVVTGVVVGTAYTAYNVGKNTSTLNLLGGGSVGQSPVPDYGPYLKTNDKKVKEIYVDPKGKSPEARKHGEKALEAGIVNEGKIDRAGAKSRRVENLKGTSTEKGKDRDEFPPAVIKTGKPVSVEKISSSDNRRSGAELKNQIKDLPDGTKVRVLTSPPKFNSPKDISGS